jgi:hypothetical protein
MVWVETLSRAISDTMMGIQGGPTLVEGGQI